VARRLLPNGNCGVTEMSGSSRPLYLLGARLSCFTGIPPLYSGCGLMFTVSTYEDKIGITFTSDRDMLPDPRQMRQCIDEAVAAITHIKQRTPQHTTEHTSEHPPSRKRCTA
jgi:diacylglycerol O-acyltransferase